MLFDDAVLGATVLVGVGVVARESAGQLADQEEFER